MSDCALYGPLRLCRGFRDCFLATSRETREALVAIGTTTDDTTLYMHILGPHESLWHSFLVSTSDRWNNATFRHVSTSFCNLKF
jgi:hypothetical protein